ncbi:hypothetical protein DFH09DRAFT_1303218 [Mycena vulgaris]|nr:hypothetical protein DFH09DRAFT_1303218 [Mycena vulgaris]
MPVCAVPNFPRRDELVQRVHGLVERRRRAAAWIIRARFTELAVSLRWRRRQQHRNPSNGVKAKNPARPFGSPHASLLTTAHSSTHASTSRSRRESVVLPSPAPAPHRASVRLSRAISIPARPPPLRPIITSLPLPSFFPTASLAVPSSRPPHAYDDDQGQNENGEQRALRLRWSSTLSSVHSAHEHVPRSSRTFVFARRYFPRPRRPLQNLLCILRVWGGRRRGRRREAPDGGGSRLRLCSPPPPPSSSPSQHRDRVVRLVPYSPSPASPPSAALYAAYTTHVPPPALVISCPLARPPDTLSGYDEPSIRPNKPPSTTTRRKTRARQMSVDAAERPPVQDTPHLHHKHPPPPPPPPPSSPRLPAFHNARRALPRPSTPTRPAPFPSLPYRHWQVLRQRGELTDAVERAGAEKKMGRGST